MDEEIVCGSFSVRQSPYGSFTTQICSSTVFLLNFNEVIAARKKAYPKFSGYHISLDKD